MQYLTAEWLDAAADALAADDTLATALAGVDLTIEHTVVDGDAARGAVTWHVAVADGKVSLAAGPAPRADVRFTTDRATAAAIASGALPAQRAFVEGRLQVGGDLSVLITHQRAVAAVDDALAPLRPHTTYE
jgi:glutamine cyclotransferase